jgi:hypothetical protein
MRKAAGEAAFFVADSSLDQRQFCREFTTISYAYRKMKNCDSSHVACGHLGVAFWQLKDTDKWR